MEKGQINLQNMYSCSHFAEDTSRPSFFFLSAPVFEFLAMKKNNRNLSLKTTKKVIYLRVYIICMLPYYPV